MMAIQTTTRRKVEVNWWKIDFSRKLEMIEGN